MEARRWTTFAICAALAACGGESGRVVSSHPFCQEVIPAMDAFLEQARQDHPTPDDPRYGGTAVVASIGEIADGMNAAVTSDFTATQHQQFVNLMTLIDYDENAEPRGYLAERFEVADDGRSVTFYLRDDVLWHDGERTDAEDVAFTWEVVTDPLTAFPNAAFWTHYVKGPEGVEVIDDFTVRIHLEPHADFMDPFRTLGILPQHLLGDVPRQELKQHPFGTQCPVGNGPFAFWMHAAQDRWEFVANPAFPEGLGGRPFLDRYVYRTIPEQTTIQTELLTENIDVYVQPRPDQIEAILEHPNLELMNYPSRQYVFVGWNARKPQLADPRVRKAITMGTNREEIVGAILQGYGSVANAGVPPFHWAYDEALATSIDYDPEGAKALLDEAGWVDRDGDGVRENSDGVPLSISVKYNTGNQQRQDIAELMQAQLIPVGIDIRPQVVEWGTLINQINTPDLRDFDGVVMGWVVEYKLDDTDLFHSERIDQPYAWSGTSNPDIDRLLDDLSMTASRDEARTLWREYQMEVMDEQPYTFFYFPDRLDGVNRRLKNVDMDARGEWLNIREWYIEPADRR